MKRIVLIAHIILIQACTTMSMEAVGSRDRPGSYYQAAGEFDEGELVSETLLGDDDEWIKKLLYHKVKLPDKNRIAILKLSRDSYWRYYSNDFTELNDSLVAELVETLRSSSRVYDASFLPAMLVPERRTVPVLREAAARFQADLLFGYRSRCNSYEKYRFFSSDEAKSYCSIESVVLDIRSGIVIKSAISTEEFVSIENETDTNFAETQKRAELEAVAKALGNIAREVVEHLENVPTL